MSHTSTPIVFVVDSDPSVIESLELLVRAAGWRAETFASAQEFLARPRSVVPSCLIMDVASPTSMVSNFRSASLLNALICRSFFSPAAPT